MSGIARRPTDTPLTALSGVHKLTSTETGWSKAVEPGPRCMFCNEPARLYQPLTTGAMIGVIQMLWWCKPCETTWVA